MPLSIDIGQLSSVIENAKAASASIDRGPMVSAKTVSNKELFADVHLNTPPPNIFIAGVHKWGDPTLKVSV